MARDARHTSIRGLRRFSNARTQGARSAEARIAADRGPGSGATAVETELAADKHLARVAGTFRANQAGVWRGLGGTAVDGYEIHMGRTAPLTSADGGTEIFVNLGDRQDGLVDHDGTVAGTYIHGLFERAEARTALVQALAAARGFAWTPPNQDQADDSYEVIADALEANLALDRFVFQLD